MYIYIYKYVIYNRPYNLLLIPNIPYSSIVVSISWILVTPSHVCYVSGLPQALFLLHMPSLENTCFNILFTLLVNIYSIFVNICPIPVNICQCRYIWRDIAPEARMLSVWPGGNDDSNDEVDTANMPHNTNCGSHSNRCCGYY